MQRGQVGTWSQQGPRRFVPPRKRVSVGVCLLVASADVRRGADNPSNVWALEERSMRKGRVPQFVPSTTSRARNSANFRLVAVHQIRS